LIAKFGKSLEAAYRRIRPYLSPAYRRAYGEIASRGLGQHHSGEPIVCCDFTNPAIDSVGGRYYFSLVRDLIDAGYFPVFVARRATLSTFGTSRMKSLLLKERLGVVASLAELKEPFFLITDHDADIPANATQVIRVSYQWRVRREPGEVEFPVFVHPQITTRVALPYPYQVDAVRTARIFFGGNTEEGKYDKNVIRRIYGMLTRRDMLAVTGAAIGQESIHRPVDGTAWLASTEPHAFVLCETQHCKIPQERWLDALARADFFLACPGVGMPLCHNLIEAMAAGAVPILQYAAYLPESLKHGVNCLSFHDPGSLRDVIDSVMDMSQEDIQKMRKNVQEYYDEFLAPGRFTRRLLCGPHRQRTLLLNAYRVPR